MKSSEITPESRFNESASNLISYGLVTAMMTCAALTLVSFIIHFSISWQPRYLAILVFLTTLERLYTYRRFNKLSIFTKEWFIVNATQWIVILIFIKLTIGLSSGVGIFLAEIPLWQVDFQQYFLSPEVVFTIGLVMMTWTISSYYAELLGKLGLEQAIINQEQPILQAYEIPVRDRLIGLIFSTGSFLIVITALIRLNLREVLSGQAKLSFIELPPLGGGGASTLLYFIFALALLSQSQFIDLHTRWSLQRIPVSREVAVRWVFYGLVFFLLVAGLVSLLPTSYSLGALNLLGYALNGFLNTLVYIIQIIVGLLMFLIGMLSMLFGGKPSVPNARLPLIPKEQPPSQVVANPAWWEASKAVIFWIMLAGILVLSTIVYLNQHKEILDGLKKIKAWNYLARFWTWLTDAFGNLKSGFDKAVETGRKRLRARRSNTAEWFNAGFLNLRRLNPRQRVYFFYLALIRRSGESGLPRRLSQTPSEFAARLDSALPEAEPDIDALTEAFIEARYTPRPVAPEKANRVKEVWEHLRKMLRGNKMKSGK